MLKHLAIFAIMGVLSGPAAANDTFASRLGLEPGEFTLNELVQIMNTDPRDRATRIELIRKKHAHFAAAVRRAQTSPSVVSSASSTQ